MSGYRLLNKLDRLLKENEEYVGRLQTGEIEGLAETFRAHRENIRALLQKIDPSTVAASDLQKLSRLLASQNNARQLVHNQKQLLAEKIAGLRNGRSLAKTYTTHP